ncbi:hypothetical protein [Xanthomonas vesicatoria]|uniref:Uncharacterized protein n=1 Tax=Xanthomonas vesicatoria ATCC 35937 TaxID=925775 RepID=F0BH89_9XANT|nr:hypothetical protein [Xanthomonas vesicatoria]APP76383.1 hypothetical protein BJD12_15370 [Xanthomonas vesicatoria ATCC 35937]EGD08152.1 hypothetical protein XVE_3619 [Xanthomonas vesicatoria ATCC 35937]KTF30124.1 hypothetical protein LMG920_20335 [Xanthomonas vesicatoria]KTF38114.1 hypothetical protein LMG919_04305 [Xanthomonas vesicatoria]MCC8556422.1 hypothetical protein [Xanthomonas vesicatoria]
MSRTLLPAALLPSQIPLNNDGTDLAVPPSLPFLHLWTGPEGASRLTRSQLPGFGSKSVGGGAAPQWLRPFPGEVLGIQFAVLPVGWVGDWHESPHPQWVIPLRGRWFIETGDGTRVEMGPGDIHFGQDQGTTDARGHRSGQLGDAPCFQMLVQFAQSPCASVAHPFGHEASR